MQSLELELLPGRKVGSEHPVFFIAECGINHNGSLQIAKDLIVAAKACGADAAKFQKRTVEAIFTKAALDTPYRSENAFADTYGNHKRFLEFDEGQWLELRKHADNIGIPLVGSGWDEQAVDMLEVGFATLSCGYLVQNEYQKKLGRVQSRVLTSGPHTAKKGKPIIVSTGMANLSDVDAAVRHLRKFTHRIVLMQCTSTYPSRPEIINLNVLKTYAARYPDVILGYSGHESGVVIAQAAMCFGACVVEKHFTLDRTMQGSDHAASLELSGLRDMVLGRRKIEAALGSYEKTMQPGEEKMKAKLAKSAVSTVSIRAGTVITRSMITFKSPGDGIMANAVEDVLVGKRALCDIDDDTTILCKWVE